VSTSPPDDVAGEVPAEATVVAEQDFGEFGLPRRVLAAGRDGPPWELARGWADLDRDGHLMVCPPKTPHSTRVIALYHTTVTALRAHQQRQVGEQAAYGPGYRASGYVVTCLNGDPMAPDQLTRAPLWLKAQDGGSVVSRPGREISLPPTD
jgi:hypothetical protein